jgi:tetratricopeptide (TPR) repeat protein
MAELWPKITELSEKLRKDPASRLFVPLAEEYIKAGLLEEAVQVLTEGLKRYPDFLIARVTLGRIYFQEGKFAEAREELEEVVKVNPDNLMALRKLAAIYRQQGLLEKANSCCTTLLAANPKDAEMQQLLEEVKAAQAKEEQAESDISVSRVSATEQVFENSGGSPMVATAPASEAVPASSLPPGVQTATQQEPVASQPSQKATETSDAGDEAQEELVSPTLAQLYLEQGHYARAVRVYDELLRREPNNTTYHQARKMALTLQGGEPSQAEPAVIQPAQSEEPAALTVDHPSERSPDRAPGGDQARVIERLQSWLLRIQQQRRRRAS